MPAASQSQVVKSALLLPKARVERCRGHGVWKLSVGQISVSIGKMQQCCPGTPGCKFALRMLDNLSPLRIAGQRCRQPAFL